MSAPTKNFKPLLVYANANDYRMNQNPKLIVSRSAAFDAALTMAAKSGVKAYIMQPNSCVVEVDDKFITGSHTDLAPNYEDYLKEIESRDVYQSWSFVYHGDRYVAAIPVGTPSEDVNKAILHVMSYGKSPLGMFRPKIMEDFRFVELKFLGRGLHYGAWRI
jgi:hypothetical protein